MALTRCSGSPKSEFPHLTTNLLTVDSEPEPMNDLNPARVDDPLRTESESAELRSCFQLLGRVEDQIRFADSKAGFLATLHAFLISPLIYNVGEIRKAFRQWDTTSLDLLIVIGGVYVLLYLISMGMIGMTVLPRIRRGKQARQPSRIFFGRIAREFGDDPRRFVALISAMSEKDWLDEIAVYIVDASTIATVKHRYVRWATLFSVPTVFFWILTVLVLFCAGQS